MSDVRAATLEDRPAILSLLREMIPGVDAEARWRWLYETNPAGPALTWLSTAGAEIAGCTSFFPFRLWLDGEVVQAALGGDGFVRPAFRRTGRGFAMHYASWNAMWTHRIGCMYGAPGAMNVTPLKRSGSTEVGEVARWVRPIRAAGLGVRLPMLGALSLGVPDDAAELEPMRRHDPRVDRVWAEARADLRLAAVRDAAFYTWRFLEAPAGRQLAFVILDRGSPIGACAVEATQRGRVLRIVDLVTVPGAWHAGLRAIVRYAIERTRAESVDMKLFLADGRRRQMWRSGFAEREHKPFLCMIPKAGDRRFLDPDRWYYNGADSDLDTLEGTPIKVPRSQQIDPDIVIGQRDRVAPQLEPRIALATPGADIERVPVARTDDRVARELAVP
jgi:hypothetical protein